MKKETGFLLVLFVGLAAFVMGFSGMSHAQPNVVMKPCHKNTSKQKIKKVSEEVAGADVIAIFVLKSNGDIEVMEGPVRSAKKPGGGAMDQQPNASKPIPWDDLKKDGVPDKVKAEFPDKTKPIKKAEIIAYTGDTCTNVNGTWYCW